MSQYDPQTPAHVPFGSEPPTTPTAPKSGMSGCWKGCAVLVLVSLLLCGGGAVYVYMKAKDWATDAATFLMKQGIKSSDIREEDKTATIAEIDRVADAFKAGKITGEELGEIMQALGDSPLTSIMMMYSVQEQHLNTSGLTDEEKAAASLTLQRVERGVVEGKISNSDLRPAMAHVVETGTEGQEMTKVNISDEDLRKFVAELASLADEKEIEEGEFQLDVAKELRRIVDETVPGKLP